MKKQFGDVLKSLLDEKGITAYRLAVDLNIDRGLLSKIVNNKRQPSLNMLQKIADYLEVSTDRLLGREGE